MKLYSLILLITFSFSLNHLAQDIGNYLLDSIVVTANRVPTSVNETGRSVVTILPHDILFLPANDIHDLLEYTSGIDLKQRGPEGIQSDISIRGGSFEQTLIMIDGIKLIDPQTGHHNMNIPLAISQVERIEILKGQGSRVHGANAFSGIINIIPKKNMNTAFDIDVQGGENAFWGLGVNGSLKIGQSSHRLSVSQKKSDGYRRNTEFNVYNLSMNNSIVFKNSVISTMFGFTQKDFGANSYYTVRFPDQAEITETSFASLSADISFLDLSLSPKFYWRRNNDEFVLDKFNPGFYKNNHETDVIGGEIQAATNVLGGSTSFGLEFTQDNINSNNLGKHNRQRKGFFIEQKVNLSKALNFSMGGYAYYYSQIAWRFWPGIDLAYKLSENFKLFANYGNAFRIPTYTELYYSDPITQGNSELEPEESTNYEIGINSNFHKIHVSGSYFFKKGKNLIDYIFDAQEEIWKAENFSSINTEGFEINAAFDLNTISSGIAEKIMVDYTFINSDKEEAGSKSRYVLEHLKHDLSLKLFHKLPFGIIQSWTINYEDRITLGDHFTVDAKMSRIFPDFDISLNVRNLFNKSYEEIPGVLLPGRWIITGIKLKVL